MDRPTNRADEARCVRDERFSRRMRRRLDVALSVMSEHQVHDALRLHRTIILRPDDRLVSDLHHRLVLLLGDCEQLAQDRLELAVHRNKSPAMLALSNEVPDAQLVANCIVCCENVLPAYGTDLTSSQTSVETERDDCAIACRKPIVTHASNSVLHLLL